MLALCPHWGRALLISRAQLKVGESQIHSEKLALN
jgi:hypothetical protein